MTENLGMDKERALAPFQGVRALTKQQATLILRTIWPDAPGEEVFKAALICRDYGLNPLAKHIYLIPFNKGESDETWETVMSIKATRLIASRDHRITYLDDTPRVMTNEEQEQTFGEVQQGMVSVITKLKDTLTGREARGYGHYALDKKPKGTDKGNTRFNMAAIRSERQAFDRLCPGEMPQVEVVDAEYIDTREGVEITTELWDAGVTKTAVDMDWLKETMAQIKWTEATAVTWLKGKFSVKGNTLTELLGNCTREQQEEFTRHIQGMADKVAVKPLI